MPSTVGDLRLRVDDRMGPAPPGHRGEVEDVTFIVDGQGWQRALADRDHPQGHRAADSGEAGVPLLIATGKTEQMDFHYPNAIKNGVTQEELVEMITHLAFYVGWPNAMSAVNRAKALLAKETP
jgi:hypothetical protein